MKIDDEFFKDFPVRPSDEFLKFIEAHPDFNTHQLIYRAGWESGKRVAVCKCTACEREFTQEYVPGDGDNFPHTYSKATFGFRNEEYGDIVCGKMDCLCPICGEPVRVLHVSDFDRGGNYRVAYGSFLKVEVIKGVLCFFEYSSERYVDKNGKRKIYTHSSRSNAYTKRNKKTVVENPYNCDSWHVNQKYVTYVFGFDSTKIFPFKDEMLVGTDFENAKLEKYCFSGGKVYPAYYILTYREHPNVENLVMNGASYYLSNELSRAYGYYYTRGIDGIDFSENRPSKMLGLNKDEFKIFVENRLDKYFLDFYLENKSLFSLEELVFMKRVETIYGIKDIIKDKFNPVKICRYLLKQKERSSLINYQFLKDYWNLSEKVGILITEKNMFPKNLKGLHDNFAARIEQERKDSLKKKYEERFKVLDRFSFEKNGLLIRPCAIDSELFNEGKKLDHCVYGYASSHCNGSTAIFFLRTKKQPDKPYYTVEFNEKAISIKQNHGYKNDMHGTKPKPPEVEAFIKEWLKHCRKVKELENGKSSSKSKSRVAASS